MNEHDLQVSIDLALALRALRIRARNAAAVAGQSSGEKPSDTEPQPDAQTPAALFRWVAGQLAEWLRGTLDLNEKLLSAGLDPEKQMQLEEIVEATATLLAALNELLELHQVDANPVPLADVRFNPRELVESLVTECRSAAWSRGVRMASDITPDFPVSAMGDSARLRKLLAALIIGAIQSADRPWLIFQARKDSLPGMEARLTFSVRFLSSEPGPAGASPSLTNVDAVEAVSRAAAAVEMAAISRLARTLGAEFSFRDTGEFGTVRQFTWLARGVQDETRA